MLDIADSSFSEEQIKLTGVILAGGKNGRMGGSHKALLPFRNEKLVHRQIRILKEICKEIIVVTNEPRTFLPIIDSGVRIITDFYENKGPLGGMHAALSLASHTNVWMVGCD